jgi:uncharacterized membrane protein
MGQQLHNELKKEFQLERLILFSDAVFAIAITLLVIEIKIPEIHHTDVTEKSLLAGLIHLIPKFIGFIISFFVIGLYWTIHHRHFGFVVNYDNKLLWLNLIFLLFVALMPFSTGFYSEYFIEFKRSPFLIYVGNISLLGFINYLIWKRISNPANKLSEGLVNREMVKYNTARTIVVPLVFLLLGIVYFIAPVLAIAVPPLIPFIMILIRKKYENKIRQEDKRLQEAPSST